MRNDVAPPSGPGPAFALLVTASLALPATAAGELHSWVGDGATPAPPWTFAGLPKQALPATSYAIVVLEGARVLRVEAQQSYGNLLHRLPTGMRATVLTWRWRVDKALVGAELRQRSGDDAALKVCAMFDLPLAQVPFMERQLLHLAQATGVDALPTATLCYVADARLPAGTLVENPYTRRVRSIVIAGPLGRWTGERRDLAADFRRAFGDEAKSAPALVAVAVGADADNTGSHSLAYVDALQLSAAGQD